MSLGKSMALPWADVPLDMSYWPGAGVFSTMYQSGKNINLHWPPWNGKRGGDLRYKINTCSLATSSKFGMITVQNRQAVLGVSTNGPC